ncbi:DCD (Development and Cell Death) domain protein [Rhynchospora pubera]|uniref:DCD (Development and Cell Death) domain protein n=1 Tax=Rhynchospora pubera TaxID=906938 RepID=A0AAV8ALL8_9POAL|nr:DCD (Development and Cell Death) domain protein [Rhynchospora pubera]KAJ4748312.1 DCD (Development and Cell Death) domain protein [Rhynchospora pubera]KAJ4757858.1 DCD (Development and Cell Death) domain protein [Rhynchospora pubera]KAJ4798718.1 DCD (Development and Cell Death) domain protein [Rhynchospora pubera]KAJ4810321.1 DCD (Development and Cell Death) domain protein [Rhynchospora pubera]
MDNLWHLGDEFRGQPKVSEDHQWSLMTSKLTELTRSNVERVNTVDYSRNLVEPNPYEKYDKFSYQDDSRMENLNLGLMNLDLKMNEPAPKSSIRNNYFNNLTLNMNVNLNMGLPAYQKSNTNSNIIVNAFKMNPGLAKYSSNVSGKDVSLANNNGNMNSNDKVANGNSNNNGNNNNAGVDKRFKTLPSSEMLPRNEVLGGYIFVCNNDTMQEDLKRQLFGLPARYRDSVRAITPGLPLFLYNYTTHQLHGIFEATSFGGSNIDPTAWEDKKCKGESRFPAQVRIRVRKLCKALDEDAFRPVLHHYDGPKFRLELSIAETLALLDLCEKEGM